MHIFSFCKNTEWQLSSGVLIEDKIKPYLPDSHIGQADHFGPYAIVKTWHIDLKAFENCLIFFD